MAHSAVILAGGLGTRLLPLTQTLPKPLLPIAGVENLRRVVELLCKSGVSDAAVCVRYKKEQIIATLGDCCCGVKLSYYAEDAPAGTAGAVRKAYGELEDTFIVISADVVCDFELSQALGFHKANKADVTIITHRESCPLSLGVVMCAGDGRVTRFAEKPGWEQVFSDTVNTGIYIMNKTALEEVPPDTEYDFSRDLFPRLLSKGARLFGCELPGYWRDMGTPEQYLAANMDALDGKAELDAPRPRLKALHRSLAGENCTAADDASISDSVLFDGVSVGQGCVIEDCIIAGGVIVEGGCALRGCVVAQDCVVPFGTSAENRTITKETVRESEGMKEEKGTAIKMISHGKANPFFDGSIILGLSPDALGAACGLGAAAAKTESGKLGVICSSRGGERAETAAGLFALGAYLYGGRVFDFGVGEAEYASVAGRYFGCSTTAVFELHSGLSDRVRARFYDRNGLPQTRVFERALTEALNSASPAPVKAGELSKINALPELYCAALTASGKLDGVVIGLNHMNDAARIKAALTSAGATVCFGNTLYGYDKYYFINNSGSGTVLCDADGTNFDMYKCLLSIFTLSRPEELPAVALPYFAPKALSRAAEKNGIEVSCYLTRPSCEQEYDIRSRELCGSLPFLRDPLFCAVRLICLLKRLNMSMAEAASKCEDMYVRSGELSVPAESKAAVLRALYEEYLPYQVSAADGVAVKTRGAEGTVMATDGKKLRLIISSYSEQYASDAFGELEKKIKNAVENDGGTMAEQ